MAIKCPKCNSENTDTARFCSNCAAPLPPSEEISAPTETLEAAREELTTGSTFAGRYQIIEELGKGGMGKVYRAIDKQLKEEVALKLIKPEISSDKRTVERFSNELKLARKIAHKNVGRMYELMEDKGTRFITMEYVPGEDLKSLTRRVKQLTVGTAISIAEQVCEGLSEAHRLGVVHRDLKPQNIMIDKEGNARIMDFGIARSITGKGITGAGVMIGTPEYMSPEQVEVKEVDQRSDIYSLGVILYEMVTGRVPFEGETPLGIALKHKSEVPKDPKELNAQIPDDLNLVILKCLEKDKDKRYQNAGEVRSELTRVEKSIPTTEIEIPKRKPITSREITLTFGLKKFLIPALVVIALVIVGVVIWQILLQKESIPIPVYKHSIAVLPFDDLSPQKDQEYFCDGIAEELINSLTKIKDLRVVARTSAFSFKGEKLDVREIGKKLNVATVLEGSVRKADNRLRIIAQLINVEDGYHLWSERYDREMKDVFAIQDEISIAIVDSLKVRLLKEEKAKIVKHFTEDLEAYNLYLQGRYFWNKRTEKGLKKGVECFQQAIEKDPGYALAYAGLADSYVVLAGYAVLPPKEAFPKAKAAALKALELDEMLAEAHDSLANVLWEDERDSSSAEREFKRAIELKPSRAMSYKNYAEFLAELGRHEEAIAEIKRAQELDPLSLIINALAGWIFCMARQYDHAIEECRKVLEMDSQFIPAYDHLGLALIQKGMYEEAISAFQKAASLSSESPLYIANLAYTYAVAGKRNEAYRLLEELEKLSKQTYVPAYCMALIYTGLEEKEQALVWLEKANDEQYFRVLYIKEDPRFGSLKSHPGFTALLKKMGLE